MFVCNKCGAHLEDGMKLCDKCGSDVTVVDEHAPQPIGLEDIKPLEQKEAPKGGILAKIAQYIPLLPQPLGNKNDRSALMIGLGSVAGLSLVYIICFFVFMADMCAPIAMGVTDSAVDGASPLWMLVYFALHLFPLAFCILTVFNKKYRLPTLFAAAFSFVLTLFSFISWGICEPATLIEAFGIYNLKFGSVAWFVLVDSLSEVWYLKLLLALGAIFGFGVDYIVNEGK